MREKLLREIMYKSSIDTHTAVLKNALNLFLEYHDTADLHNAINKCLEHRGLQVDLIITDHEKLIKEGKL